jgi:signal transduction histidine kinase
MGTLKKRNEPTISSSTARKWSTHLFAPAFALSTVVGLLILLAVLGTLVLCEFTNHFESSTKLLIWSGYGVLSFVAAKMSIWYFVVRPGKRIFLRRELDGSLPVSRFAPSVRELKQLFDIVSSLHQRYLRSANLRRNVLHGMGEGFQLVDARGQTLEVNPALLKLAGRTRQDFIRSQDPFFYLDSESQSRAHEFLELSRTDELIERMGFDGTLVGIDTQAAKVAVLIKLQLVELEGRNDYCITVIVQHRPEQSDALPAFDELNRLRMLARFSGGVAHNLNNLLTSITSALSLIERKMQKGDMTIVPRMFAVMREAGTRSAELIDELLLMSRLQRGRGTRHPIDVTKVCQDVIRVASAFRSRVRHSIELCQQADGPIQGLGDESGLHQVLLNLLTNAMDAMPLGGIISITVKAAKGDADEGIVIEVKDRGLGMDAVTQQRLFEPFFTTKTNRGKNQYFGGNGLGLSSALALVESWGGTISVESEPGQGSVFRIFLQGVPKMADIGTPL